MSVINKMLRDLDQRQSTEPIPLQGTVSVPQFDTSPRKRTRPTARWTWAVFGASVVLAVPAALWQAGALDTMLVTTPVAPLAPSTPAAQVTPAPSAAPVVSAAAPVAPAVEIASLPASAPQPPSASATPIVIAAAPPKAPTEASAPVLRMDKALTGKTTASTASQTGSATAPASAPATAVHAPTETASNPQRQQLAAKETIANAQALWNAGSHDAAIDLMQEAVTSAERNPANGPLLAPLVREWARMQLAESRPGPVWDLLTRLEPQLRNEPDLWAVRANAAQRLGRHQDSLQAYVTALQSRPNEQRWLLGAAVSLAALGQTASAAEMADKARAVGPISRDVQAYLRQMGVPLKDQ